MPRRADVSTASRTDGDAGAVPLDPRQVALRRPPAVAVHDDGDVRRQPVAVDLPREQGLGRTGRQTGEEVGEAHAKPRS